MKNDSGFLLLEALILVLILSIAFVSFAVVVSQALKVSYRTRDMTEVLASFEPLLFEIENGFHPDLAAYGGKGALGEGASYEIQNQEDSKTYGLLKGKLLGRQGKNLFEHDLYVSEGALE
jgi:Tfp pilus assembly protein PilV